MSVRLPECISTAPNGRIFEKFDTWDLRKYARKPNLLKTGQEYQAFYMKVYERLIVSGDINRHKIALFKLNGFRLLG